MCRLRTKAILIVVAVMLGLPGKASAQEQAGQPPAKPVSVAVPMVLYRPGIKFQGGRSLAVFAFQSEVRSLIPATPG